MSSSQDPRKDSDVETTRKWDAFGEDSDVYPPVSAARNGVMDTPQDSSDVPPVVEDARIQQDAVTESLEPVTEELADDTIFRASSSTPAASGASYLPRASYLPGDRSSTTAATNAQQLPSRFVVANKRQVPGSLAAHDISAWFGNHKVLDRVSLNMPAQQVTALIGPSGCGKSTFLRILNRMHEMVPSASLAGEVLLDGDDIYDPQRKVTEARRHIGMVFQKPNPFPAMSIYENVVSGLKLTGIRVSTDEKDWIVEDSLRKASLWDEVKDRLEQPGAGLSGGQQQRLCIARSLAVKPRILLMDEPCSALDPTSTNRVEETIHSLKDQVTIVIVTHNMQQARRVSDQTAFFLAETNQPGVIVEYGPTEDIFDNPQDIRTGDYVNGRFG